MARADEASAIAESVRDISKSQSLIADKKLKLDLFAKRFEVFENINEAIGNVITKGGPANLPYTVIGQAREQYFQAIAPARYIFDDAAWNFLEDKVLSQIDAYLGYVPDDEMQYHDDEPVDEDNRIEYMIEVQKALTNIQRHELHNVLGQKLRVNT